MKEEQLDPIALPAIPAIRTLHNRQHNPKQNVVVENTARVTVTTPCKRRGSRVQKRCSTTKVARLNEDCPNKALSEALLNLLVNKTPDDIAIDHDGFAYVGDILKHRRFRRFSLTQMDVRDLVKNDDKSCFAIEGRVGNLQIRATCGHSLELKKDSLDDDISDSDWRDTESVLGRPKMSDLMS